MKQYFPKIHNFSPFLIGMVFCTLQSQTNLIPNPSSHLSFSFSIPYKAIEESINKELPEVLVNDNSFTDNQNDQIKMKIKKDGTIKIKEYSNSQMQMEVPLEVWVEKQYGFWGNYTSQKIDFKMKMYFAIKGSISATGDLITETQVLKYEFVKSPVMNIAGIEIPLNYIVEKELNKNKATYCKKIDAEVKDNIPLSKILNQMVNYFSQPYKTSDEYNAWIDFNAQKIAYTPFNFSPNALETRIQIESSLYTYISETPIKAKENCLLPPIISVYRVPETTEINSYVFIPFDQAIQQSSQVFLHKNYSFKEDKYRITLTNYHLSENKNRLQISLTTEGDFNGNIELIGQPEFDPFTQQIFLKNSEIKVYTRNLLHKAALWIKEKSIQKQLETEYGIPMKENLQNITQNINQSINTTYYEMVNISGNTQKLDITELKITPQGIFVYFQLRCNIKVNLQQFKTF